MSTEDNAAWQKLERLARIYAYLSFGGVTLGILAAHFPYFVGLPWTSCKETTNPLTCTLVFHLYEVPIVLLLAYSGWYAFKRFTRATIEQFKTLVLLGVICNIAFFTFESALILDSLHRNAAEWESLLICGVAMILVGGAAFGIYVHQRLISQR